MLQTIELIPRNDDNNSVEIYEPNTLIAMPDHVLERIFNLLNFQDKKSFAASSKKFNEVFSRPQNWDTVWFNLRKGVLSLSRSYTNIIWDFAQVRTITDHPCWTFLASNLTSLRVENSFCWNFYLQSFFDALSNLSKLTHLDVDLPAPPVEGFLNENEHSDIEIIEMKNLNYLKMDLQLFAFMEGRYVNFAETKKLHTLILQNRDPSVTSEDCNNVLALVKNQANLKTFHLFGLNIRPFFDFPINLQNKLEDFKLNLIVHKQCPLNLQQQNNFCDFVNAQQPKYLKVYFYVDEKSEKIKNFLNERMDLPLEAQHIKIVKNCHRNNRNNLIVNDEYTSQDFMEVTAERPNFTTEKLQVDIGVDISTLSASQIVTRIATKFPNLKSIDIQHWQNEGSEDYSALNNLQHLESLALDDGDRRTLLRSITIPNLKIFHSSPFTTADFMEFLKRHNQIEDLCIPGTINSPDGQERCVSAEVIRCALENLKNLSKFTILDYDRNYRLESTKKTQNLIKSLIEQHKNENPGFRLETFLIRFRN